MEEIMNAHTRLPHLIALEQISEGLHQSFTTVIQTLLKWEHNYQTRKELAKMGPHLLDDIGLTKIDVEQELKKPFWK